MDDYVCGITKGLSVDIRRTDGRVHPATVSAFNPKHRTVTVEWCEQNETKGKEVDVDDVLMLNTQLILSRVNENAAKASPLKRFTARTCIPLTTNKGLGEPGAPAYYSTPAVVKRRTTIGDLAAPPNSNGSWHALTPPVVAAKSAQAQAGNSYRRKSTVVREVEKLQRRREARRQRQAEMKEEKEALMNVDPGNPNWEFLGMINRYRKNIDFKPLREIYSVHDNQITVCVRKRPLNRRETLKNEVDVVTVPSTNQVVVHEPKHKVDLTKYLDNQVFRFDYAFDESCNNDLVYTYTAKPLVQTIFDGGMATCFAYGQTGSGKTHTMGGDFQGKVQDCNKGIYAMAAKDIFRFLHSPKYQVLKLVVSASFFEIYSGKVVDLLADKANLRVLEDGKQQVQIVGLTETVVDSVEKVLGLIQRGNSTRTSGKTSANSNSSRSHAVFQIVVRVPGTHKVHGKFSLIDLAGNERGADVTSANRKTRMEGAEINKSLLALKECIRALGRKGAHLPFRGSKLTQVLRDSFIGTKSKTCMIAMISPSMSSCEHSLNTLRYADRVKELAPVTDRHLSATTEDDESGINGSDENDVTRCPLEDGEIMQAYDKDELQYFEDDVFDAHKSLLIDSKQWQHRDLQLLSMTKNVDYDQDTYSSMLESLTKEKLSALRKFYDKVKAFRLQLVSDETISKNINPPPHRLYM